MINKYRRIFSWAQLRLQPRMIDFYTGSRIYSLQTIQPRAQESYLRIVLGRRRVMLNINPFTTEFV
ncbi:hypothetical protein BVI1335_2340020 [Burkholderia vietnamiensis]|nr:hypothetical protein BVI1335_2340020 [Burkholderia vietnamiensis]